MADASFDVVSKVDKQEVANALNQAQKEIAQRYDFKGVGASIEWRGENVLLMKANSEERVRAVLDVFQTKLDQARRLAEVPRPGDGDPKPSGKEYRLEASLKEGIAQEHAKKITKIIRDEGPKGVKAQIQGDELRVSSKSARRPAGRHGACCAAPTSRSRCSSPTTADARREQGPGRSAVSRGRRNTAWFC